MCWGGKPMHPTDTYPRQLCRYCGSEIRPIGTTPVLSQIWACGEMRRETITDYQIAYLEAINLTDRFSRDRMKFELVQPNYITYLCGDWDMGIDQYEPSALHRRMPFEWNDLWTPAIFGHDPEYPQHDMVIVEETVKDDLNSHKPIRSDRLSPTYYEDIRQCQGTDIQL